MTVKRKIGSLRLLANPGITSIHAEDEPIGPFINANPWLIPGWRFEMGLNVFVNEPVTIRLTSSDPGIASVPAELMGWPDYNSVMFEIVGHRAGTATITATLGDVTVTTEARVREDTTQIKNLVGQSPNGPAGRFVYELGATDGEITINMTGPVVEERIAKIHSGTPEVASVPESIVIPGNTNWPQSFPLELHAVGTTRITVECRGVTLETIIEVIVPVLWIASIDVSQRKVRAGDEIDVTITMTDDTVRDIAITIEPDTQLEMPTGLVIPRGKRSGTFRIRVLENLSGLTPLGIRWLHSLHLVGLYS
jgi:hypothetical protein